MPIIRKFIFPEGCKDDRDCHVVFTVHTFGVNHTSKSASKTHCDGPVLLRKIKSIFGSEESSCFLAASMHSYHFHKPRRSFVSLAKFTQSIHFYLICFNTYFNVVLSAMPRFYLQFCQSNLHVLLSFYACCIFHPSLSF